MFIKPSLHSALTPHTEIFNAATFDGTNDYCSIISGTINDTMPTSTDGTLVMWVRRPNTGARTYFQLESSVSGLLINARQAASGNLVVAIDDPLNWIGSAISLIPGIPIPNDGLFHSLYVGWYYDTLTTTYTLILDGTAIDSALSTDIGIDFSQADSASIGANTSGTQKFIGGIGRVGLWPGYVLYTDLMNPDNSPKSLPANGEATAYIVDAFGVPGSPYTCQPMIWNPQGGDNIAINQADGGHDFIVTGALGTEVITV